MKIELLVRILLSCLCGAAIGYERTKRLKEAGIRTHVLVCCTAALLMIISKYAFSDMPLEENGLKTADPARIAAQVVSGISFLCAGVIFKNGDNIKGLTTAAGLWATSAIGLAMGAGMYTLSVSVTLIVAVIQFLMHRFTFGGDSLSAQKVTIMAEPSETFRRELYQFLQDEGAILEESRIRRSKDGQMTYQLNVRFKKAVHENNDMRWEFFMDAHPEVTSVEYISS